MPLSITYHVPCPYNRFLSYLHLNIVSLLPHTHSPYTFLLSPTPSYIPNRSLPIHIPSSSYTI
jgi:hypothetical protein